MSRLPIIAIVDDDESVRTSLDSLVRSVGYSAQMYCHAEDFLTSNGPTTASCLISDIQMPGMNGIQLYEQLTAQGFHIPVIFITGHPNDAVALHPVTLKAAGYLYKPFDARKLISCIKTALHDVGNVDC
jgi:FixJ family two-component response regulator